MRDKWHLDEVVIPINGVKYWLWRAIDADGTKSYRHSRSDAFSQWTDYTLEMKP